MAQVKEGEPFVGFHTFRPFLLEYAMMSELREVERRRIPGMYVIPSATSALVWFGVLIVRSGYYTGGVFKFILIASEGHPHSGVVPVIIFQPPVFHPLVDMVTGQMNCNVSFRKWRSHSNSLAELLEFIKDAFYQITTLEAVNPEASSIYASSKDNFKQRAAESVQFCRSRLFDCLAASGRSSSGEIDKDLDGHVFPTSLLEGVLLEETKSNMMSDAEPTPPPGSAGEDLRPDSCNSSEDADVPELATAASGMGELREQRQRARRGLSWVKPGTASPFSADGSSS